MNVVLLSTYDLGHQPFGLASPRAFLARDGHNVACTDLSVERLSEAGVREADVVAFFLPMHTATRLALPYIAKVRQWNPKARIACYGLYAPLQEELLRSVGVDAILGGEFEQALCDYVRDGKAPTLSLDRLKFPTPDRTGLPDLSRYSKLHLGDGVRLVAYTEASRGCKHLCRHCPVVPVYSGQFRVVQRETVLADVRGQVGKGATHVTFGDPDFFNGPKHAIDLVRELHTEFPQVSYDATIKIEHLLKHRDLLGTLRETGCVLITSAVESLDDAVLEKLQKNHNRADFLEAVGLTRRAGIALQPTFIAFTPWTTLESYRELLTVLRDLNLVDDVAPVQLALRLLVTPGSRLFDLEEIRNLAGPIDPASLVYPWVHPDPKVDELSRLVFHIAHAHTKRGRRGQFQEIWNASQPEPLGDLAPRTLEEAPYFDEPWYCCAEPMPSQVPLV